MELEYASPLERRIVNRIQFANLVRRAAHHAYKGEYDWAIEILQAAFRYCPEDKYNRLSLLHQRWRELMGYS